MKKSIFKQISIFVFICVLPVLLGTCKQYKADLREYLSYWATQAFVVSADIKAVKQNDSGGISCVGSSEDVEITLALQNPKNFTLVMPSASEPREIVSFGKLGGGITPKADFDYTLTQPESGTLKLVLKKAFLQKAEWGLVDISPTITLYPTDGRKFTNPFTFGIKSNTAPPLIKKYVVAKTESGGKSYYVLCLTIPDMDKTVPGGLLHKDLANIEINGKKYPFSVNKEQTAFTKPEDTAFLEYSDVKKLDKPDADEVPAGWVLYYNTGVEAADGSHVREYAIKLLDNKALASPVLMASTNPNKPKPATVSLKKGESAAEVNSDNDSASPHRILIDSKTKPATLHLACATAGSIIHYSLTETAGGVPPVSMTGSGSGFDLELPIPEGRTEADYKLEVRAEAAGFTTGGTRTLYYKVTAKNTNTVLRELKLSDDSNEYNAVLSGEGNYICYIPYNGKINTFDLKATAAAPQAKITGVTVAGVAYEGLIQANSVTLFGAVTLADAADRTVTVHITVTGEDTNVTGTYTLTVRYAPVLTGLEFKQNGNPVPFRDANDTTEEPFKPEKYEYHIFADTLTPFMNFTYQAESGTNVTVKVNGSSPVTAGQAPLPRLGKATTATFTVEKGGQTGRYTVHIKRKSYTVTFKAAASDGESGGKINVTSIAGSVGIGSVEHNNSAAVTVKAEVGATITAIAEVGEGYKFKKWSGDGVSSSATPTERTYRVEKDTSITAEFTASTLYVRGTGGTWYNTNVSDAAEGNDTSGEGSKQKPYATVRKAVEQCKEAGAYTISVDGQTSETDTITIEAGQTITIKSLDGSNPAEIHDSRSNTGGSSKRYLVQTEGTLTLNSVKLSASVTATHGTNADSFACGIKQTGGSVTVTGATEIRNFAHAVEITGNDTFTMDSGSICNNYVNGGASGVTIDSGTFALGGTASIKNNEATNFAGVYINSGTFTMSGGEISGNKAGCLGGGIGVYGGMVSITGGHIKNNRAAAISYKNPPQDVGGGGIYMEGGTVTFENGTIEANYVDGAEKNCGAGVFVKGGLFEMKNGTITGCKTKPGTVSPKDSRGGGVYISGGTFKMEGGTISSCEATDGGGVYIGTSSTFTMNGGSIKQNTAVSLGGGIYVAADGTFNAQPNTIIGGENAADGNSAGTGGGVYVADSSAKMRLNKCTVANNTAHGKNNVAEIAGGGIYIGSNNTHSLIKGCKIKNNRIQKKTGGITYPSSLSAKGAGIYVNYNSSLTLENTAVINNEVPEPAGFTGGVKGIGVCLDVNGSNTGARLTMKGSSAVGTFNTTGALSDNNDVYLSSVPGSTTSTSTKIICNENLTSNPVAQITPQHYSSGTQVLEGGKVDTVYVKFKVTPNAGETWKIDDHGELKK